MKDDKERCLKKCLYCFDIVPIISVMILAC